MRQFLQVLSFELKNFVTGKWYKVSTILVCVLVGVVMFVPRFLDMGSETDGSEHVNTSSITLGLYDPEHVFTDQSLLKEGFPNAEWISYSSQEELEKSIKDEKIKAGFMVEDVGSYRYLVLDSSMNDQNQRIFDALMNTRYQTMKLNELGVDTAKIQEILATSVHSEISILGTDGVSNYFYTYILVFALYFIVLFYGQMTAQGVASEKGNRAVEILITSASPNALIFGKVIAGAIAGIVQAAVMLGFSMLCYQVNAQVWNHSLDFLFDIPVNVLLTFAVFGTLGYLFYSFIYGALGAMVSKVEEVGSATSPITIIFIMGFFLTFYGMMNPDSLLSTIASYLPFSSCMAMFARVAMGSVGMMEILLSALILLISTILMGLLGAKLYRRGTLSYGNSFRFSAMIKELRKKD